MQMFRDMIRGWFGKVLLVIFIAPFAFIGMEGLFSLAGRVPDAATVNGEGIPLAQFDREVQQRVRRLKERFGGQIDEALINTPALREEILDELINQRLLLQFGRENGVYIHERTISQVVENYSEFRDDDGLFSPELFERYLQAINVSKESMYRSIESDLITQQLSSGYGLSAIVTPSEIEQFVALERQTRDFSYLSLSPTRYISDIEISDDAVQAHYDANSADYMTEEQVRVQYLALNLKDYYSESAVSDDEIQAAYDDRVASIVRQERRNSSHIFVEVNDDRSDVEAKAIVDDIVSKLNAGEAFEDLAKRFSEDYGTSEEGGLVGMALYDYHEPEVAAALYALKAVGEVSEPVKSEFGYSLVRLEGVEELDKPSLDSIKTELAEAVQTQAATEAYIEDLEVLTELSYDFIDNLEDAAGQLELEVKTSDWFDRSGGEGLFANQDVVKASFSDEVLKDKENSAVIEIDDTQAVVVRESEFQGASIKPVDEVRDDIVAKLKQQAAAKVATDNMNAIIKSLKAGDDVNEVAKQYSLNWFNYTGATRREAGIPRSLLQEVFKMPKPTEGKPEIIQGLTPEQTQVRYVTILKGVSAGTSEGLEDNESEQYESSMLRRSGSIALQSLVETLRQNADINIVESALSTEENDDEA